MAAPLLDRLAQALGTPYLSDLHCLTSVDRHYLIHTLRGIQETDYSPEEWADAISYILGIRLLSGSRDFLLSNLDLERT